MDSCSVPVVVLGNPHWNVAALAGGRVSKILNVLEGGGNGMGISLIDFEIRFQIIRLALDNWAR
jgi:hypothetical protein